jgi:hypothetical protein
MSDFDSEIIGFTGVSSLMAETRASFYTIGIP